MMSSTIASNGVLVASTSASEPSCDTSTAKLSACNALRINDAVFFSSSTTSTRMALQYMVRRHFHSHMLAFRNPGLHSFAEKKSKWEKVGKAGKRWKKAGNPALNPEESAVPSRLFPLPARFLSLEFCVLGVLLGQSPSRIGSKLRLAPRLGVSAVIP